MYVNVQAAGNSPAQRVRIDRKWVNKMSMRFNFAGQYATDSLMDMEDQNIGSDQLLAWIMREMGWEKRLLVSQKMKLEFALRGFNHYLIDHGSACWYRATREWHSSGGFANGHQGFLRRVPSYRIARELREIQERHEREMEFQDNLNAKYPENFFRDEDAPFYQDPDPHGFTGLDRDRSRALMDDIGRCARL